MKLQEVTGLKGTVYENGYKVLKEKGLVIIWMSVGNSYFDKEKIQELVEYAQTFFSAIKILIPYEPAIHTYMALGYNQTKASSKARLGSNRLKNHSQKVIGTNTKVEIVNWSKRIANNTFYQNNLNLISELYRVNQEFQTDAEEATKKVLMKKSDRAISEKDIKIGTKYLLEELAFVLSSPDIFEVQSTVYMYHRNWPIYEKLVNGEYDNKPRNNLGFLLVNEK